MGEKEFLLTQEGYDNLVKELEYLKTEERYAIAERIKVALGFGDLSENSEYDEAKNEQAIVESRIAELDGILKRAKIIDPTKQSTEHVHLLSKVKVHDWDFDEDMIYQIVSTKEADPFNGKLSDESPVGMGLLNHQVGDIVEVETPDGIAKYSILEIMI